MADASQPIRRDTRSRRDASHATSAGDPVLQMMAADRASRGLGIELVEHGAGWARARMVVRDDMVNGHDMAHGGLVFALADTAFACACNSWGPATVAAGCEITYVASARLGDTLEAHATARTRYGRHGVYDVTVRRGEEVVAEFRGRSHQLSGPSS
jgi:acyl-CoA thioesterase